ncbi:MAG: methyltransferase family protein [Christensenellales bacterium]|jgi:protein-S-isoprenylcysteine O-methyltransferase Ste14
MQNHEATRKKAVRYSFLLIFQRVMGLACFLAAAGTLSSARGWIFFALYFILSALSLGIMLKGHRQTLAARTGQEGTMPWDKVFVPVYTLLHFYIIYIVAGLEVRFGVPVSGAVYLAFGIALYVLSGLLGLWSITVNTHFESTARLQKDRGQRVVSDGPYGWVRHPGYLAIILWCFAAGLMFGTRYVWIVSALVMLLILVRTYLEDAMLLSGLSGYADYARRVPYRLIPLIW